MENIFKEIDSMLSEKCLMLEKFTEAFLREEPVVVEKLFPCINSLSTDKKFQLNVTSAYRNKYINKKERLIEEINARQSQPNAFRFYKCQIDKILSIKTFDQLIDYFGSYLNKYPEELEILNDSYIIIHNKDGTNYIKNNYVNYKIGYFLYKEYQSIKNRSDMLNMKCSESVRSEYKKVGIDINSEDSQFRKNNLISLSKNIQIFNQKDSQTIKDQRLDKYFHIDIPRNLLTSIESLIEERMITKIAFRVDYISDYLPSLEDKEFGLPMKLNISSLPRLSKFCSRDNHNDGLWVKHNQKDRSLIFEEIMDDFEVVDNNIVTQVVHLEYILSDHKSFITHLDHEFIIYTDEEYEKRINNAGMKGHRKVKTFKIDHSMIPFNEKIKGSIFLVKVLDSYFKNKDLISEYFSEILD